MSSSRGRRPPLRIYRPGMFREPNYVRHVPTPPVHLPSLPVRRELVALARQRCYESLEEYMRSVLDELAENAGIPLISTNMSHVMFCVPIDTISADASCIHNIDFPLMTWLHPAVLTVIRQGTFPFFDTIRRQAWNALAVTDHPYCFDTAALANGTVILAPPTSDDMRIPNEYDYESRTTSFEDAFQQLFDQLHPLHCISTRALYNFHIGGFSDEPIEPTVFSSVVTVPPRISDDLTVERPEEFRWPEMHNYRMINGTLQLLPFTTVPGPLWMPDFNRPTAFPAKTTKWTRISTTPVDIYESPRGPDMRLTPSTSDTYDLPPDPPTVDDNPAIARHSLVVDHHPMTTRLRHREQGNTVKSLSASFRNRCNIKHDRPRHPQVHHRSPNQHLEKPFPPSRQFQQPCPTEWPIPHQFLEEGLVGNISFQPNRKMDFRLTDAEVIAIDNVQWPRIFARVLHAHAQIDYEASNVCLADIDAELEPLFLFDPTLILHIYLARCRDYITHLVYLGLLETVTAASTAYLYYTVSPALLSALKQCWLIRDPAHNSNGFFRYLCHVLRHNRHGELLFECLLPVLLRDLELQKLGTDAPYYVLPMMVPYNHPDRELYASLIQFAGRDYHDEQGLLDDWYHPHGNSPCRLIDGPINTIEPPDQWPEPSQFGTLNTNMRLAFPQEMDCTTTVVATTAGYSLLCIDNKHLCQWNFHRAKAGLPHVSNFAIIVFQESLKPHSTKPTCCLLDWVSTTTQKAAQWGGQKTVNYLDGNMLLEIQPRGRLLVRLRATNSMDTGYLDFNGWPKLLSLRYRVSAFAINGEILQYTKPEIHIGLMTSTRKTTKFYRMDARYRHKEHDYMPESHTSTHAHFNISLVGYEASSPTVTAFPCHFASASSPGVSEPILVMVRLIPCYSIRLPYPIDEFDIDPPKDYQVKIVPAAVQKVYPIPRMGTEIVDFMRPFRDRPALPFKVPQIMRVRDPNCCIAQHARMMFIDTIINHTQFCSAANRYPWETALHRLRRIRSYSRIHLGYVPHYGHIDVEGEVSDISD